MIFTCDFVTRENCSRITLPVAKKVFIHANPYIILYFIDHMTQLPI